MNDYQITEQVQTEAVKTFGYTDRKIIPSAITFYKNDPEIQAIPHYVRFNRSRPGKRFLGENISNISLNFHSLDESDNAISWTDLLKHNDERPLVMVSGSYT